MDMFDVMLGSKLGGGGGGETSNYNDLTGLPQINGVELKGNKSTAQLLISFTASDVGALPDSTKYAAAVALSIDQSTYVVTAQLKDQDGNNIGSASTVDLPLETMVVGGSYDAQNQKIVLTLKNGGTTDIAIGALISGLQPELVPGTNLDTTPTSGSTNPVTSGGVWTPLSYLVDNGAKNRYTFDGIGRSSTYGTSYTDNGVTYTIGAGGSISTSGTAGTGGSYIMLFVGNSYGSVNSFCNGSNVLSGSTSKVAVRARANSTNSYLVEDSGSGAVLTATAYTGNIFLSVRVEEGVDATGETVYPMICTKTQWDISHTYEPYCPTMAEMYAMIQALQGTRSVQMRTVPEETSGEEER